MGHHTHNISIVIITIVIIISIIVIIIMVLLSIKIVFRQSRSKISELDQLGDGGSEGSDSEASGCTVASPSPPYNFGNWFWGIYFKDTLENQNEDALSHWKISKFNNISWTIWAGDWGFKSCPETVHNMLGIFWSFKSFHSCIERSHNPWSASFDTSLKCSSFQVLVLFDHRDRMQIWTRPFDLFPRLGGQPQLLYFSAFLCISFHFSAFYISYFKTIWRSIQSYGPHFYIICVHKIGPDDNGYLVVWNNW